MFETDEEIKRIILGSTLVVLIFIAIIILFLAFYRRRRSFHQKEKEDLENNFKNELLRAKIEVQETTLQHFTSEIHDNIGQKLAVARIYINRLEAAKTVSGEKNELEAISLLMGEAINDLRTIANTVNRGQIGEQGLVKSLQIEAERFNQLNIVACYVEIKGDRQEILDNQQELLLFRICQEFIQNSIKHAACNTIYIYLYFTDTLFTMQLKDNGKGFNYDTVIATNSGNGLRNMRNRAKMLGGDINIFSENGTVLTLKLPIQLKRND